MRAKARGSRVGKTLFFKLKPPGFNHLRTFSILELNRVILKQTEGIEIGKDYLWGSQPVSQSGRCWTHLCGGGMAGKLIPRVRGP